MGKADLLTGLARRRRFVIGFCGTLIAALGFLSAILTIMGQHFSVAVALSSFFAAVVFAGLVHRHRWRAPHLPVDSILLGDIDQVDVKRVRCPCDHSLAKRVSLLARQCYGSATIGFERYEQLRLKNPLILACLVSPGGEFLGYFDVIPLRENFADLFLEGKVKEEDLTHDDVLAPAGMKLARYVYVSGLAVANPEMHIGKEHASILVWAMLVYLQDHYGSSGAVALASAVTPEGEHLLKKFKLDLASHATARKDGCPMYTLQLSSDEIARRLHCLPDYSSVCDLDWRPDGAPAPGHLRKRVVIPMPMHKVWELPRSHTPVRRSGY